MPNYYNPYNFYPQSYMNQNMMYPQMQPPQQNFSQQSAGPKMMEWVEGEVGAKAFQMPQGWPANSPIPLWDSTDTVIYLKSWGPMGIPNPMQKLKYELPEQQSQMVLTSGQSGNSDNAQQMPDMSQFATKQDLEQMKADLRSMMNSNAQHNNQNGSNNGNRGAVK